MTDRNFTDDHLMTGVRRAFSHYVAPAAVPPGVPRGASLGRPPLIRLSLAAVPIATLGLVIVLTLQALTQPSSAFATWTAVPDEPDSAAAASATAACWEHALSPRLPLTALDQRGRVTVALFSDGQSMADCMLVDGRRSAFSAGATVSSEPLVGAIEVLNHGRYDRESTVHVISGGVGPEVASVVVTRDDGVEVTATVSNGMFLVWWPTADDAATFTALDGAGEVIASIENPSRLPTAP